MDAIFFEITLVIFIAALLSLIFKFIKQPPILAYILTGVLLGPFALFSLEHVEVIESLASIGITLLLFILGLELKISELKRVGKTALFTGVGQIFFTSAIGFAISVLFGFSYIASLYISVALTFSSTIIIVKLLTDKRDLNTLYGRIAVGFLLIQDFFAILALIILSGFSPAGEGGVSFFGFLFVLLKGFLLFAFVLYLSNSILPRIVKFVARSHEILFLFSLAWVFGISALVSSPYIGFSIEIGGFLAGLALAHSAQNIQIASKVRSLRDFFITLFFIHLGIGMVVADTLSVLVPALAFSAFVLIGNPLIVMVIMGLLGYKSKTSFFAGLTVAQISEFSLIVIFLGNRLGHFSSEVITLVTLVGIVTFVASTYMIMNNELLYKWLRPLLKFFEKRRPKKDVVFEKGEIDDHVVLIGSSRMGEGILRSLEKRTDKLVVVDSNPEVVHALRKRGITAIFGDVTDPDIQSESQMDRARLIISTVPFLEDNFAILNLFKDKEAHSKKVIIMAHDKHTALRLYEGGADYVIIPHLTAGRHLAEILHLSRLNEIHLYRQEDIAYIQNILK